MMDLLQSVKRLSLGKRLLVVFLLLLIALTWLGVCLILGSYLI